MYFEQIYVNGGYSSMQPAPTVQLPSFYINRPSGTLNVGPQAVTLQDTPNESLVDNGAVLRPSNDATGATQLSCHYVSNVQIWRQSDGHQFAEGPDFRVEANSGKVFGLTMAPDTVCNIGFTASKSRYDRIGINPITGAAVVVQGVARYLDAEEYMPELPAGILPFFVAYIYGHNVDLLKSYNFRNMVQVGDEMTHDSWLALCRDCLPKTFKKLRAGAPLVIASYGDSNTACGGSSTLGENTDGDRLGFFASYYPADTLASFPTYNENGHVKTSVNFPFVIKETIEARWGSAVTLRNFGVGGSNSTAAPGHGGDPARLAQLAAAAPDLVLIAFGMNEIGSASICADTAAIIDAVRAMGAEPLVFTVPAFNLWAPLQLPGWPSQTMWEQTNEAILRAARSRNAAFVSTHEIFGYGSEGTHGMSLRSCGSLGWLNHPGRAERKVLGKYASLIFS